MCGIASILNGKRHFFEHGAVNSMLKRIRHRGPDDMGVVERGDQWIGHVRLAIVDPESGRQPFQTDSSVLAINGEIYNHRALRAKYGGFFTYTSESDCEVVQCMLEGCMNTTRHTDMVTAKRIECGGDELKAVSFVDAGEMALAEIKFNVHRMCREIDGIFAFSAAFDGLHVLARDPIGICPLYYATCEGSVVVCSEIKGFMELCFNPEWTIHEVQPGTIVYFTQQHAGGAWSVDVKPYKSVVLASPGIRRSHDTKALFRRCRTLLTEAVRKRLMCDVPYATLLSGGLDSSLVTSIAARLCRERTELLPDGVHQEAMWPALHTFSVGMRDSPDHAAARVVADFLKTKHHEITYDTDTIIPYFSKAVKTVETRDKTTVRSSAAMIYMAEKIHRYGIKMVLSGEGSDEIAAGYLYFHKAPDARALQQECLDLVSRLHQKDVVRANKSMMAASIECRVPFLDLDFVRFMLHEVPAELRMPRQRVEGGRKQRRFEKWFLRAAFDPANLDEGEQPYLPPNVLWRVKEQFSDGVGHGHIDGIKAFAALAFAGADDPEQSFYDGVFAESFGGDACNNLMPTGASVACSTAAAIAWDDAFKNASAQDPSGRAVKDIYIVDRINE